MGRAGEPAWAGYWHESLGGPPPSRPPLQETVEADVCIVGAGYTGLWTAWALLGAHPNLRVAVVEDQHVGFGASGRNGGWLSGLLPGNRHLMAEGPTGRSGVIDLQRQLIEAVPEMTKVCADEGIHADIVTGGTLAVGTNRAQMGRLRSSLAEDRQWGLGEDDLWEIGLNDLAARVSVSGALGATFSPHCARIHPAKLVRGLADSVERRGGVIYERTRATSIAPGRVVTAQGPSVRAPWAVRATEGYTAALPGWHRRLLPMNSSIVVTEPLEPGTWARIGWNGMETLRDGAHAYVYLQRTADGRIAIGGRGVPYRYGSRLGRVGQTAPGTVAALASALERLFPSARGVQIARAWSGVLGVARDWCPSVGVQPAGDGGLAWAGGYVGDGVATSYVAGQTVADLVLGRQTARTALPWVGHQGRDWEPEPFRWLGVHGIYGLYRAADRAESGTRSTGRTSRWATAADLISGRR